jgi:hypothetical protein
VTEVHGEVQAVLDKFNWAETISALAGIDDVLTAIPLDQI